MDAATTSMKPLNDPSMRMPGSAVWSTFSHDGERLYTGGGHPDVWVWDARTLRLAARIPTALKSLSRAALHPRDEVLAAGGMDGTVRTWDLATGTEILCAKRHPRPVSGVRWLADGAILVSSGAEGTVRLTDARSGERIGTLQRFRSYVHGLATAPSTRRCGALHVRGALVWDWEDEPRELFRFDGIHNHGGEGQSHLVFADGGDEVWMTCRGGAGLRGWKLGGAAPRPIAEVDVGEPAFELAFSPDRRLIAVALHAGVVLLRAGTLEILARWRAPNGGERIYDAVRGLSWSRDGRRLVTCDVSGGIWVWPIEGG
jgi:WD40 repeat protein